MRWEDLTPEQRDGLIRALKLMLGMFKDWYRTGLMQKINSTALNAANGLFAAILLEPAPTVPPPAPPPPPAPEPPPPTPEPAPPPAPEPEPPPPPAPPAAQYDVPLSDEPNWAEYADGDQVFTDELKSVYWVVHAGRRPFLPATIRTKLGVVQGGRLVLE